MGFVRHSSGAPDDQVPGAGTAEAPFSPSRGALAEFAAHKEPHGSDSSYTKGAISPSAQQLRDLQSRMKAQQALLDKYNEELLLISQELAREGIKPSEEEALVSRQTTVAGLMSALTDTLAKMASATRNQQQIVQIEYQQESLYRSNLENLNSHLGEPSGSQPSFRNYPPGQEQRQDDGAENGAFEKDELGRMNVEAFEAWEQDGELVGERRDSRNRGTQRPAAAGRPMSTSAHQIL